MSIQPPPNDLFAAWFSHRGTSSLEVRSWALDAPIDQLKRRILQLDSRLQTLIPNEYLRTLSTSHLTRALRYIFVCWHVTGETQCPKKLQIEAALGLWAKNDVFMVAGTGQGKTLAGMLNQLLDDTDGITVVISPLKRLQASQASGVKSTYRLETLIVNEDMPRNTEFWQEKAHDIANKRPGTAQVIIATPEQFFRSPEGHITKLGELVRHDRFKKRIRHIVVDEIHQLVTQGLPRHGLPAFRPCYGRLDELKSLLGDKVSWLVLTATAPLYMVKSIEICTLRPHYLFLRTTSNRSNLTYARNCVDNLKDPKNYRCFIKEPFDLDTQPTVLIFYEPTEGTVDLAYGIEHFLPRKYRNKGIVRHYHGSMSAKYLDRAHRAFTDPDDICKILVTTSAESTGIDFSHVDIVCSAGLPDFLTLVIQEYGRAVRRPGTQGLAVLFYEPWVKDIELSEYDSKSVEDLDRPRNSPLRLQASAHYLGDTTSEALTFANKFCCDSHDNGFDLRDFLPGPLSVDSPLVSSEDEAPEPVSAPKRPVKQKKELKTLIQIWLSSASVGDSYHFARPRYLILMESQIAALLIPPAGELTTVQDLTRLLDQSDDWESMWAASLLQVIVGYDEEQRDPGAGEPQLVVLVKN
ncbi:P-loop containing nucleoside triphosphate hydrolase protein [Mycena floridula]|nr:P-loop containing nucleoside triphosphate hydrolase protein [Mycena floridula]